MRLTYWRPRALYWGRGRKPSFIVIEQLTPTLARKALATGKFRLVASKPNDVPVFFRLNRVRLKLNPLARNRTLKISSVQGSWQ